MIMITSTPRLPSMAPIAMGTNVFDGPFDPIVGGAKEFHGISVQIFRPIIWEGLQMVWVFDVHWATAQV